VKLDYRPVWATALMAALLTAGAVAAFFSNVVPVLWWAWWYGPLTAVSWALVVLTWLAVTYGADQ
jgi:hypothetical protein